MRKPPAKAKVVASIRVADEYRVAHADFAPGSSNDAHNIAKGKACEELCAQLVAELKSHTTAGAA
jgi:hypothetical protein